MSKHLFPIEATALDAQHTIADEFSFFSDWSERYQYLIDLGKKLPAFPDAWKIESNRLTACQSMVWVVIEEEGEHLHIHAISDSTIVSGLIYLALRVYSGRTIEEIASIEPHYITRIGLAKHLSPTRSNGHAALLAMIREHAKHLLASQESGQT
ncbi:MAG: SufE family protein [Xanthomonadales bacterium]|jgi:cysteine desulfuration protein SufE|nr:SufE family protein [Xanthomonadales bacterium]